MTVFRPDERPDVEVLVDDVWYPGELRAWQRRADGWWANVNWTRDGMRYLDTVLADRVRPGCRWPRHAYFFLTYLSSASRMTSEMFS